MSHRTASRAITLGIVCIAFFLAVPRHASAQDPTHWHVVELRGSATVMRPGVSPVSLADNAEVEPGDQIKTEVNGHVILRHGGDTVLIAPNSLVGIPAADTGLFTRVLQTFGTVLVNVAKRPDPHFEVRTPFLAAIVKGTTFTVSADSVSSAVQVVEGVVNVVDSAQRQSVMVTAGQTARISSRTGGELRVDGPRQNAPSGSPDGEHKDTHASAASGSEHAEGALRIAQPIGLAAIDAAKASGGLLRNDEGRGPRQAGRSGSEHSALAAPGAGGNRADGAAGPAAQGANRPPAGLAGLMHAGSSPERAALGAANGNAGGNGNGNAFGNGNGNAGGNGNGNAGGNGNGNAGGNGNGNAGGNGNGNGGVGNGNGKGNAKHS